jgi:hypothetical protein
MLRLAPLLREDDMLREPRLWLDIAELLSIRFEELKALLVLGPESRETCRLAILSVLPLIRLEEDLSARLLSLVDGLCLSPPELRSLVDGLCRSLSAGC